MILLADSASAAVLLMQTKPSTLQAGGEGGHELQGALARDLSEEDDLLVHVGGGGPWG